MAFPVTQDLGIRHTIYNIEKNYQGRGITRFLFYKKNFFKKISRKNPKR